MPQSGLGWVGLGWGGGGFKGKKYLGGGRIRVLFHARAPLSCRRWHVIPRRKTGSGAESFSFALSDEDEASELSLRWGISSGPVQSKSSPIQVEGGGRRAGSALPPSGWGGEGEQGSGLGWPQCLPSPDPRLPPPRSPVRPSPSQGPRRDEGGVAQYLFCPRRPVPAPPASGSALGSGSRLGAGAAGSSWSCRGRHPTVNARPTPCALAPAPALNSRAFGRAHRRF